MIPPGIKTPNHVFIPPSHHRKHQPGQERVTPVDETQPVFLQVRNWQRRRPLNQTATFRWTWQTGVRNWKAKRVPVGMRLAKLAVTDKTCDNARCGGVEEDEDRRGVGCGFGDSCAFSSESTAGFARLARVRRDMFCSKKVWK
ncbi:OLC1v1038925C1 [Oldenlandia corymbosa var. corymbosa]|uniref:OLC1v1038925C1 n=1 Tax=Oldenlandia corymbosa var. corymbosa TaxID=529605 RepID=A0AAV1D347_OLDCO|nr:OLC1v1038925C1 [Oldenlandia corymbosa var. corymbosa]